VVYVLGSGPLLWRVNGTSVTEIQDLPKDLFGGKYGQSFYDMAIAVRPDNKDMVAVGGSTVSSDSEWSGAIFQFTVAPAAGGGVSAGFQAANQASPDQDPTFIGTGVHGDIHQIRFIAVGTEMHMWVPCDGGIFRSTHAGHVTRSSTAMTGWQFWSRDMLRAIPSMMLLSSPVPRTMDC
jgi:hypothetical protein